MQSLIRIIKSIRIKQVLTIFLVSSLLFVSTACGQDNLAQTGGQADTETAKRAMSDTYDEYDANQSFKGGMNGYNDDRRYDTETSAKAKRLIDAAKSRQKNNTMESPEEIVDRVGNEVDKAQSQIPRTLNNKREQAVDYIQDKSENLKNNLSKVPGEAKEVFDEATDTAQGAIQDATKATTSTTRRVKDNFEDLT